MRRRALAVLTAAGLLLLAACTDPAPSTDPDPTSAATTEDPAPVAPEPAALTQVDPTSVTGLSTYTVNDEEHQAHAVVPQVEGFSELNDALTEVADTTVAQFIEDFPNAADADVQARPSVTVTWSVLGADANAVGFLTETELFAGADVGEQSRSVWYDVEDSRLLGWADLIDPGSTADAEDVVIAAVDDALAGSGYDVDETEARNLLTDGEVTIGFDADGALVVGYDEGAFAAMAAGAVRVAVPDAVPMLSEAGQRARLASIEPRPAELPTPPAPPAATSTDCAVVECVAITFDDGPSGATTPGLLDILADAGVPATFFTLGSQASAFPDLIAAEIEGGHEVASHSWSHPQLTTLSEADLQEQLSSTTDLLEQLTGTRPTLMRPPYGATDDAVAAAAAAEGQAQILWSIDTLDWQHHDPDKTIAAAAQAQPGAIILMHDIHATTIEAVPGVIEVLQDAGYTLVTVSDLLDDPQPGEVYGHG